jgi:hypothetical protein
MSKSKLAVSFGEKLDLDLMVGEEAPPATDGIVIPQDVHMIMGELEPIEESAETTDEILARTDGRPRRPGTLVITPGKEGEPLVLQAVVYDFDRQPPTRELHVFEALMAAFEEAKSRSLTRLAVRPLGTAHMGLEPQRFLALLTQVCYSSAEMGTTLRRVHLLLASPDEMRRYEILLQKMVKKKDP